MDGGMSPAEAALRRYQFDAMNGLGQFAPIRNQLYGATAGVLSGGLGTMQNLGNSIGNQFDIANLMGSQNRQKQYAPMYEHQSVVDTNRTNERMATQKNDILSGLLPHLIGALGQFGGGGGNGFQTNYGAGVKLGSNAQPTNTAAFRQPNPLLQMMGG